MHIYWNLNCSSRYAKANLKMTINNKIFRGIAPGPKKEGTSRASGKGTTPAENADIVGRSKDFNYKLCFLASYVSPAGRKVLSLIFILISD